MTEAEGQALLKENAELRAQLSKVLEQVATLNDRVAELLAVAQRKQRKPAADKKPESGPVVAPAARRAFDERPRCCRARPAMAIRSRQSMSIAA